MINVPQSLLLHIRITIFINYGITTGQIFNMASASQTGGGPSSLITHKPEFSNG